jgi:hypothetical protein
MYDITDSMDNPFQFGRELGADELVDRDAEIADVIRALRKGEKLFLIGPRRYGKTSILKAAGDRAAQQGTMVLRYNAEGYPTLDLLVSALIADVAKSQPGGIERVGERIKKFFSRLRPELTFSVTESSWKVALGAAVSETGAARMGLLIEALAALEKMAADLAPKRRTGLVLDEFQKIIELGGEAAEGQIRAAIQQHRHVGYVFAGSKTRMLTDMTAEASRPFYRLGSVRFLGPVPRAEFAAFLKTRFSRGGFRIEGSAAGRKDSDPVALILDLAEEVPYNVQSLAHACWEQLTGAPAPRSGKRTLDAALVHSSLERVVRQYDPFYTQLWNQLTSIQQRMLIAVMQEGGVNLQSMKMVRTVGKGASTLRRSLDALLARDILREEESHASLRFRFEDPFFGAWIRHFAPHL